MLFCHFDEKNSKKSHSKLFETFFCFFYHGVFFMLPEHAQEWALLICSKRPSTKADFQGLISQVLLI